MNFAIVVSDFNQEITSRLLEGAQATLHKAGVARENVTVTHVPGAFEIPFAAKKMALTKKISAIIALGCVIRGETIHFDVICNTTALSLQQISLETGVPITSGILMAENDEQALARSGGDIAGDTVVNRGSEAASAALQMVKI